MWVVNSASAIGKIPGSDGGSTMAKNLRAIDGTDRSTHDQWLRDLGLSPFILRLDRAR
jgi:hypothetical protein